MSNPFLNPTVPSSVSSSLSNGQSNLNISTIAIQNLLPNLPVITDSVKQLSSSLLSISMVENLQDELDAAIQNPLTSNLDAGGYTITNINNFAATGITDNSLTASSPVLTNANKKLVSGNLAISQVTNLQTSLNNKADYTAIQSLNMNSNAITNASAITSNAVTIPTILNSYIGTDGTGAIVTKTAPVSLNPLSQNIIPDTTNTRDLGSSLISFNNAYVNNFTNTSLTASSPVLTDVNKKLVSGNLAISQVTNLQTSLNNKADYTATQSINMNSNAITNASTITSNAVTIPTILNSYLTTNGSGSIVAGSAPPVLNPLSQNIIPDTTNTRDIGSSLIAFNNAYVNNITNTSLTASSPVLTDVNKKLVSGNLTISQVTNLQTSLNNKCDYVMTQALNANNNNITNTNNITPNTTSVSNLGSTVLSYNNGYIDNVFINNTKGTILTSGTPSTSKKINETNYTPALFTQTLNRCSNETNTRSLNIGMSDSWSKFTNGGVVRSFSQNEGIFPNGVYTVQRFNGAQYTIDGINYTNVTGLPTPPFNFHYISDYIPSLGVCFAVNYTGGAIYSSTDGMTWTNTGVGCPVAPIAIIWTGLYVVYISTTQASRSLNGTTLFSTVSLGVTISRAFTAGYGFIIGVGNSTTSNFMVNTNNHAASFTINPISVPTYPIMSIAYSPDINIVVGFTISAGATDQLNNFYYSYDNGYTWINKTYTMNGQSQNYGLISMCFWEPTLGLFYCVSTRVSGGLTYMMAFSTEQDFPIFNYTILPVTTDCNIVYFTRYIKAYSRFIIGMDDNTNGFIYSNPTGLGSFITAKNTFKAFNEMRMAYELTTIPTQRTFIANTVTPLTFAVTTLYAHSFFSIANATGIITYTGPRWNYSITINVASDPTNNQPNRFLNITLQQNAITPSRYVRIITGNNQGSSVCCGGSVTFTLTLNTNDTLSPTATYTNGASINFYDISVYIRALYS